MASAVVVGQQYAVVCYLSGSAPAQDTSLVLSGLSVQCGANVYAYLEPVQAAASSGSVPFDYTQAFGFWSVAFTSVVALYFACRGIGTVVEFIRRS
jgi:hypothetical protein